jgi:hypothetical protein
LAVYAVTDGFRVAGMLFLAGAPMSLVSGKDGW